MNGPRQNGPRGEGRISQTVESWLTAAAVVMMIASVATLVMLVATAFAPPRVGDLVVFRPGARVAQSFSVTARHAGTQESTCTLDPAVMQQGGGSLVVESRSRPAQDYRVHWAGSRTADGANTCGQSADLILREADLQSLVNAMGGRGLAGRGNVF